MNPVFGQIAYLFPPVCHPTWRLLPRRIMFFASISHYYNGLFMSEPEGTRPIFFYRFLYIDIFSDIGPAERERKRGR